MWRVVIFFSVLNVCFATFAKASTIDSLKIALDTQPDKKAQASILYALGDAFWAQRNYQEAEKNLQKSIQYYQEIKDHTGVNDAYFILGRCYYDQAKHDDAILAFTKAKDYALVHHQEKNAANQFNAIGITNKSIGKYPEAVKAFQGALSIYNELKFEEGMAAVNHNLGIIYREISSLDSALVFYEFALNLREKSGSDHEVGQYLQSIANIYRSQKKYDESIVFAKKSILRFDQARDSTGLINAYGVIGLVQLDQGLFAEAKKTFKYVLTMAEPLKYNLANTYFSLGETSQHLDSHHQALAYFDKALENAKFSENGIIKSEILLAQSISYEKLGAFDQALQAYRTHVINRDSIEGVVVKKQIKEIDAKYQSKIKDNKIALLAKDNQIMRRSRTIILSIFLITLLLGLVGWQAVRTQRLKTVHNNLELKQRLLRAQIRPHFLFNALTSIQSFTLKNGIEAGAVYLASFAKLMRSILENSSNEYVTIKDELESVGHYLKLEKLRHGHLFSYEIEVDPELNQTNLLIPPMLIQPFLENAIKHGFVGMDYAGKINISIQKEADYIQFSIQDNGVGFAPKSMVQTDAHRSRSLKITKERLKMLNNHLDKPIELTIKNLKETGSQGTLVFFELPLIILESE